MKASLSSYQEKFSSRNSMWNILISQLLKFQGIYSILIFGLALRLFQIGKDSFWFDELGVYQVVNQTSIIEAINISHQHVMAMPLHYAIVWTVSRLGDFKEYIRIPEAIWGVLTIWIGYKTALLLMPRKFAMLSALLIAISPILIMYSQELRFYSGLVFFYMASVYLGIIAINHDRLINWILFCLLSSIGISFHVYCVLSLVVIFAWLLARDKNEFTRYSYRHFLWAVIYLLFVFIILLYLWGSISPEKETLFRAIDLFQFIFAGIGWAAPYPITPFGIFFFLLLAIFGCFGILICILYPVYKPLRFIFFSLIFQIILILCMNILKHYFLAPRQLIFIIPFFCYLESIGVWYLSEILYKKIKPLSYFRPGLSKLILLLILILAWSISIVQYYNLEKGIIKTGKEMLIKNWHEGETICIFPKLDSIAYIYYWETNFGNNIQSIEEISSISNCEYVITNINFKTSPSYRPIYLPQNNILYPMRVLKKIRYILPHYETHHK